MQALTLQHRTWTELPTSDLATLQAAVGGYIEPAFTVPSPVRDAELTGYVNEEGLLDRLPFECAVRHPNGYVQVYAGPLVCTALSYDGDTLPLLPEEATYLQQCTRTVPVLQHEGLLFCDVALLDFASPNRAASGV